MRHLKSLLNHRAHPDQKILQFHDRGALLCDGIDGFQLSRPLPLQGVQTRILERNRGLRRK